MNTVIKAKVIKGTYHGEIVRISNVSVDEMGRKKAACILTDGRRANIPLSDLEVLKEMTPSEPPVRKAKTASMPFISGSTSSRTMTHTKNMQRARMETKSSVGPSRYTAANCESCGIEYNMEGRKGREGKVTHCEYCAEETEIKMEGKMIFSHKTGATIEIKKDGELRHEADTFDPKNKIN